MQILAAKESGVVKYFPLDLAVDVLMTPLTSLHHPLMPLPLDLPDHLYSFHPALDGSTAPKYFFQNL
jgi:hypothetical protein